MPCRLFWQMNKDMEKKEKEKQIECSEVTVIYGRDTFALEEVSLTICKGEFLFLTGRNGSGKTTLLKLISAQKMPTTGRVWVNGSFTDELTEEMLPYFRRKMGLLQADIDLLEDRTVLENVEFAMMAIQYKKKDLRIRAEKALSITGVLRQKEKFPRELSGGEKMRVMLARSLVNNPDILILDEPTSYLDADEAWDLMCLLKDINQMGVTIVAACHDMKLITIMKQRVVTLVAGTITADEEHMVYDLRKSDIFMEREVLRQRELRLQAKKQE